MPNTEWNRKLDLSAPKQTKPKAAKPKAIEKPRTTLTARQIATYSRAVAGHERWLARLLRAATEVQKHRATIRRFKGGE